MLFRSVISDLRCLFTNRANRNILIDVAFLSDFGITGNIYPMQAVGQNRLALEGSVPANISSMLVCDAEKEKTQNILERQIGNSVVPCEQFPVKPQEIALCKVDDSGAYLAVPYLSVPHSFTDNSIMLDMTCSKDIFMPDIPPTSAP